MTGRCFSRRVIEGLDWRFWFKDAFHWDSHLSFFTTSSFELQHVHDLGDLDWLSLTLSCYLRCLSLLVD